MIVNIGICVSFLIVLLIISVAYFTRDRINSIENRCFKKEIIITIFGLIIESIIYFQAITNMNVTQLLRISIKLLYVYYVCWMFYFILYGFIVFFQIKEVK